MSDWFALSLELLARAFPDGLTDAQYLAVLNILSPHLSQRNLSDVMTAFTGRDPAFVSNDVLGIDPAKVDPEIARQSDEALRAAGFEQWLRDA